MPIETTWRLAQAWYYDRLSPEWARASLPEIRALFIRLGLTGPAWELP